MSNLFEVTVPTETLDARPSGGPMPTGPYRSVLQSGTELAQNDRGWVGIRLPFLGFEGKGGSFPERAERAQFTVSNPSSPQSETIGAQQIINAARAVGIAEQDGDGWRLTATSPEELVEQFNSVAGTPAGVYVKTKPSQNLKDDGTPFINNEITRVFDVADVDA